ncbi:MAG TPA: hypothetical protein VF267_05805 [Gammaproteobacteria bacterium]
MKIVMLAAIVLPFAAVAEETRDFSLSVPAEDVERLQLESKVGQVVVRGADIDVVEVRARLEPGDDEDWWGHGDDLRERLEKATLEQELDGETLRLKLDYDDSGDADFEEHWEVRVPARLALDLDMNVGEVRVEDTAGGVESEVNVGSLDIDVREGDVTANVNVGEVVIRNATDGEGAIELESNIGDVRLSIDGESAGRTEGWLGSKVVFEGDGEDDVNAGVNVGEIRVDIR